VQLVARGQAARQHAADAQPKVRDVPAVLPADLRRRPVAAFVLAALGAYLAVIVLSLAVASDRASVLKESLKWGEAVVVVAIGASVLRTPRQRWTLAVIAVATGLAEALLGYLQWVATAGQLGQNGSGVRVFGTFGQPNPYAASLNLALPFALAVAVWGRDARARWAAGAATVLLAGAEVLAGSRGALLGLAAADVVMVAAGWGATAPRRVLVRASAAALGVASASAVAWAAGIVPRHLQVAMLSRLGLAGASLNGPINDANFDAVERLAHWAAGIRMFQAHPLLGVGAGNYAAAYWRYAVVSWSAPLGHAHNYYINAAAETGVVGLLAFLAVLGSALRAAWRAATTRPADVDRGAQVLGLGVLGVVVAVAAHSMVDDLFVHAMELHVALCVALALSLLAARCPPARDPIG
jgi:O-antigen ligase